MDSGARFHKYRLWSALTDKDKNEVIDEMELSAFTNLFQNLQDYVVGILNEDEILQQMGCVFLSENALDIEF